jgi:hypothetical protein
VELAERRRARSVDHEGPEVKEFPKPVAHLVTALARMHEYSLARRSSLEAGSTREKMAWRSGETQETPMWYFGTGNRKCR